MRTAHVGWCSHEMLARVSSCTCFGAVLLVPVIAGCTHPAPTVRLKAVSESLQASDITEIRELIKEGADVDVRNKSGATSLFMASQEGHAEIVKLLLEAKADVNAKASVAGKEYTPLSIAKRKGHTEIVRLLEAAAAE